MLSLRELKVKKNEVLDILYDMEDSSNYDVKSLGKVIDILQDLDFDKEFIKYNGGI
jgi:hypothetical protein